LSSDLNDLSSHVENVPDFKLPLKETDFTLISGELCRMQAKHAMPAIEWWCSEKAKLQNATEIAQEQGRSIWSILPDPTNSNSILLNKSKKGSSKSKSSKDKKSGSSSKSSNKVKDKSSSMHERGPSKHSRTNGNASNGGGNHKESKTSKTNNSGKPPRPRAQTAQVVTNSGVRSTKSVTNNSETKSNNNKRIFRKSSSSVSGISDLSDSIPTLSEHEIALLDIIIDPVDVGNNVLDTCLYIYDIHKDVDSDKLVSHLKQFGEVSSLDIFLLVANIFFLFFFSFNLFLLKC
jgi:hypothetical protein